MTAPLDSIKIGLVTASRSAGGIGPVCVYTAAGIAGSTKWQVTLISLHEPPEDSYDTFTRVRTVCLGLENDCARSFMKWLALNPQDILVTSDVSRIESAFPYLPGQTLHVLQIHDCLKRYCQVARRNARWINGVTCVGNHIEQRLEQALSGTEFRGILRTVHNGASFPPLRQRQSDGRAMRLLFMGRVEPMKGAFDLVDILDNLKKREVPAILSIVGGDNPKLRRCFQRRGLEKMVEWLGRVSHSECYNMASEADILLMLSRREPFGMVTIEAMSMGCVPIAYDTPSGSTEIIEDGKSGILVRLGDTRSCAEHICCLHHDRAKLSELSMGALRRAREHFNADIMARNVAELLRDVMTFAKINPSRRERGMPDSETDAPSSLIRYQRVPRVWRDWIRDAIGRHPYLCYWLNR